MGEALLNAIAGDRFEAESAGLEAGDSLNPFVVEVLQEIGIDISANKTKKIMDLYESGKLTIMLLPSAMRLRLSFVLFFRGQKNNFTGPFPTRLPLKEQGKKSFKEPEK